MVEFTLTMLVSVPLILGLLSVGLALIRSQQITQVGRDLANMYARNVDFSQLTNPTLLQDLAPGFDFTPTGTSVAIFSKIRLINQTDCGTGNTCNNTGAAVVEQQIVIGNPAQGSSSFGMIPTTKPPLTTALDAQKNVSWADQTNTTAVRANSTFQSLLPLNGTTATLPAEHAYVVEVWTKATTLTFTGGLTGTKVYSRNIF